MIDLELAASWPWVVRLYLPEAPIGPRVRQLVLMGQVAGSPTAEQLLQGWSDFLGEVELTEQDEAALSYALGDDDAVLDPEARAATRAAVSLGGFIGRVGRAADRLGACVRNRSLEPVGTLAGDVAVTALGVPVLLPGAAMALVLGLAGRLAPELPPVEVVDADDATLLTQLVAEALPNLLANALVRTAALSLPGAFAVGLRAGASECTVRLGQGRIVVSNGIDHAVATVLEGDVEPLLRSASLRLARELRGMRVGP